VSRSDYAKPRGSASYSGRHRVPERYAECRTRQPAGAVLVDLAASTCSSQKCEAILHQSPPPFSGRGCWGAPAGRQLIQGVGQSMVGKVHACSTRTLRHRWWRLLHRTAAVSAMLFLIAEIGMVAVGSVRPGNAQ